jgi:hypothetical protein
MHWAAICVFASRQSGQQHFQSTTEREADCIHDRLTRSRIQRHVTPQRHLRPVEHMVRRTRLNVIGPWPCASTTYPGQRARKFRVQDPHQPLGLWRWRCWTRGMARGYPGKLVSSALKLILRKAGNFVLIRYPDRRHCSNHPYGLLSCMDQLCAECKNPAMGCSCSWGTTCATLVDW